MKVFSLVLKIFNRQKNYMIEYQKIRDLIKFTCKNIPKDLQKFQINKSFLKIVCSRNISYMKHM